MRAAPSPWRLPGGELWKQALHRPLARRRRAEGRRAGKGDRMGGQASEERRAPVPPPGTPPESTFPSELPSARSRGLPRAPRSGASATALAAASDGSRTTSDNYGQYRHLGGFDGLTSFRTVLHRLAMETTSDGACSPISRPREGAGAVRPDGPTGRVDRLGEPAWRRVHPLPALGMASVRPGQGAATQRGIALKKQVRRQTSRGSMRRGKTWAYPRASLERGARERVKEADAAR